MPCSTIGSLLRNCGSFGQLNFDLIKKVSNFKKLDYDRRLLQKPSADVGVSVVDGVGVGDDVSVVVDVVVVG